MAPTEARLPQSPLRRQWGCLTPHQDSSAFVIEKLLLSYIDAGPGFVGREEEGEGGMHTFVITSWSANDQPDGDGYYVNINGRAGGLVLLRLLDLYNHMER